MPGDGPGRLFNPTALAATPDGELWVVDSSHNRLERFSAEGKYLSQFGGEGKNPGDEAYFVLKGSLTEHKSDVNKKVTSQSRDVVFKLFPQEAAPAAVERK